MSVSSGFFNSVNHDRMYDAEQFSSIFDGLIIDGVYENYGDAFKVTAYSESNDTVIVGTGRAWFDHTWTYNDSQFSIQIDPPNEMLGRVDMIVIDVNREQGTRKNSILYVRGSEANPYEPADLIKEELHNQYPIAYIHVDAGSSAPISQAKIENKVGTEECPIVTSFLEAMNLSNLWSQLDTEFREWWGTVSDSIDETGILELITRLGEIEEDLADLTTNLPLTKPDLSFNMVNVQSNTVFLPDGKYVYFDYSDSSFYLFSSEGAQLSKTSSSCPTDRRYEYDFVTINNFSYPCMFIVVWSTHQQSDYYRDYSVVYETITVTSEGVVSKSQSSVAYVPHIYMRYDNYPPYGASVKSYTTANGDVYIPYIFGCLSGISGGTEFNAVCTFTVAKYGSDGVRQSTLGTLDTNYAESIYWIDGYASNNYYNRVYADKYERYLYIDGLFVYRNGTVNHAGFLVGGSVGGEDAIYSSYIPIRVSNFSVINNITTSSSEYNDFPRSPDDLKLDNSSGSGHPLTWNDLETYTRNNVKHTILLKQYDTAIRANVPYGYIDILPYSDDVAVCKTGVSNVIGIIYKGHRYYFSGTESNIGITSTSTTLDDKIVKSGNNIMLYCFESGSKVVFDTDRDWFDPYSSSASSDGSSFYIRTERSSNQDTDSNSGSVIYLKEE